MPVSKQKNHSELSGFFVVFLLISLFAHCVYCGVFVSWSSYMPVYFIVLECFGLAIFWCVLLCFMFCFILYLLFCDAFCASLPIYQFS